MRRRITSAHQSAIDGVRADIDCHQEIAFNVKDNSQARFDLDCVNRASVSSRKPVDFVATQTQIERILLENFQARRVDSFWLGESP